MDKEVVPRHYSKIIVRLAPLSILNGCYALYRGHYRLCLIPYAVGLSTYFYWRNPTYSWRRTLDICVVVLGATYQGWMAYDASYAIFYYVFKMLGIGCYLAGVYYHWKKGDTYAGILFHTGIHIFTNIGNTILYSGDIPGG